MKKYLFLMAVLAALISCSNDDADHRPGLWTAQDMIETFPGDTVLIQGQVSNYIGLDRVVISCEAWGINQVYTLDGEHAKVFNYNYQMPVPQNATFDAELKITVTDTEGTENKKTIAMTFLPDTEAPVIISNLPWQVSCDYSTTMGSGTYTLDVTVGDDRQLKHAVVSIPLLGINETIELKGHRATIRRDITATSAGTFPITITLEDAAGNRTASQHELIVMLAEDENPISDYPQLYMVEALENATDYILGYYRYMYHEGAYQYSRRIYVPTDNYGIYFVPSESMDGDKIGSSPYVKNKMLNNNGYVVPLTIEKKGYYYLWVDLREKQLIVNEFDPTTEFPGIYMGDWYIVGSGFSSFADWSFTTTLQKVDGNNYRRSATVTFDTSYAGDRYLMFNDGTWTGPSFRSDGNYWWYNDADAGGSSATYDPQGSPSAIITFDAAEMWCTIKKSN